MIKTVYPWILAGLVLAFFGILISDIFADIFNGLPYGTGAVLGICAYLCVVLVTCTGILAAKLDKISHSGKADQLKENEN